MLETLDAWDPFLTKPLLAVLQPLQFILRWTIVATEL
jgi:hypothetical protein